jgi:hypothetical protein
MRSKSSLIKILGAAIIILLATSTFVGALSSLSNTKPLKIVQEKAPVLTISNSDETTIEVTINNPIFSYTVEQNEYGKFTTLELNGATFSVIEGNAKLPVFRKMVQIPYGAIPIIEIDSISWEYTSLDELGLPSSIIPVQPHLIKIPEQQQGFVINDEYYEINEYTPRDFVQIVDTGEIRNRRFILLEITPIQYNPKSGELRLIENCEITIDLPNSDLTRTYNEMNQYFSNGFEELFKHTFANYGFYEQNVDNTRDQEGYLIIVYDNFFDEVQPLANWKTNIGFDTTTTKTSQIPGGPSKENIHDYIDDAYNTWNTPPAYVLLVGDTAQIPTYTGTTYGPSAVDLYYVTINSGDYFPDIFIGRFPAATESDVDAMVEKTVYYETGNFPSNDWIKKAAFIASNDYGQLAEQTHNYVIDNYLTPNGYVCDKIYESMGGSTQDIEDALNNGRSLCIYSGHGYSGGWGCVPFDQTDINSLTNEGMYPFVGSHACSTSVFNNPECYGETWLRVEDKGAIAFWGASASTYWDEDDILEKAMFETWWEDGLDHIGGMTDMALYRVYENYSGGGSSKYYFEAYNVLGDSAVKIWTDDPVTSDPPLIPNQPDGPDIWVVDIEAEFSTYTTDPDGDQIYYMFDWGDGIYSDWLGPFASGHTISSEHTWSETGEYDIKVKAKDTNGAESNWSASHPLSIIVNTAPEDPYISGPSTGRAGKTYDYNIMAIDPNDHDIHIYVDWDDGNAEDWIGPFSSGEEITLSHTWESGGSYIIKVRAKDICGEKSGWTHLGLILPLNLPQSQMLNQIFELLKSRFIN